MASKEILQSLAKAVTDKPPFCTGILPTTAAESTLFYKTGSTAGWLDLSQATEPQLEALSKACAPATFGRNKEDVLDESYRKARKMDFSDFSISLDIKKLGIIDRIRGQLFDAANSNKAIKTELYKLNVYDKGSFFKSHKDTPRSETMFGSLVVVFPTPHEGGALVLRHAGQEWTFDSAALTREQSTPSIAYVAFYSDVDHEVTVVESGYRVTLTYNLYFEKFKLPSPVTPVEPDDRRLRDALSAALADPSFLPEGGYLGFGLSFRYPVDTRWEGKRARSELVNTLKGSDAVIYRVCEDASLETSLCAVYHIDRNNVLVSITDLLVDDRYEDNITYALCHNHDGRIIHEFGQPAPKNYWVEEEEYFMKLAWVTPLTTYSTFRSHYIAYGNEATSAYEYADLCIAVEVGPFGDRSTLS